MKKRLFTLLAAIIMLTLVAGCHTTNPVAPESPIVSTSTDAISIKAFSLAGETMTTIAKTLTVEADRQITLHAVPGKYGLKSYQWTFLDNNIITTDTGQTVSHAFSLTQVGTPEVKLMAIDSNNVSYRDSLKIIVVVSLDNLPDIVWISHATSNGKATEVVAFKKSLVKFAPGPYNYMGDYNGGWDTTYIQAADTNWLVVNGQLVLPNAGDQGKYFVARISVPILSTSKIGAGKGAVWGKYHNPFCDSTGMIKFFCQLDGTPTLNSTFAHPGIVGDSVLQLRPQDNSVVLYTNNEAPFSSITPFIVLYDSNGVVSSPLAETGLTDYTNWGGNINISYNSLPSYKMLTINFGLDISHPNNFSPNRTKSIYWDPSDQTLKVVLVIMNQQIHFFTKKQFQALKLK